MKRLHLSNIANMAYNYAHILRQFDHHSDVLCYDLDHWLSDPSSNIGFENYPSWYTKNITLDRLQQQGSSDRGLSVEWLEALQRYSARYVDLSYKEIEAYKGYVDAYGEDFNNYDVIYGYAYGAIPPLLHAEKKYIPVDIGSLRGLSSRTDSFSKILKFSLSAAPHVIVTNPDVVADCAALDLKRYTFIPHPIDEEIWGASNDSYSKKANLKELLNVDFVILAPARHDWAVKGNDEIIRGVVLFAQRTQLKVKCILVDWGQEVARSKELIRMLNAEHLFQFEPLLSEAKLKDFYNSADAMIDQVGEALTFGLTTPKAMAAGIPVLTRFDAVEHEWCYSEMPPLLQIEGAESISAQLLKLAADTTFAVSTIQEQCEWIAKYHSKKVVSDLFMQVESESLNDFTSCKVYFSLNQKKNEIVYEEKYSLIYDEKYHEAMAYRLMDQSLIDWMRTHLPKEGKLKILDLGCGPGSMISYIKQLDYSEIHGVDLSPTFVRMAMKKHPDVTFKVGDAEIIPYENNSFDVVLCSGMLHHIPDLDRVFEEIHRVLKPGGYMFAREPNADNFSARYPALSFVHLVLKHLIHIRQRRMALVEPEEHEFHIDFDTNSLVRLLSSKFVILDCAYGQRVSYFYDMLFDEASAQGLETFEHELEFAPGLNVLVACRRNDYAEDIHESSLLINDENKWDIQKDIPNEHFRSIARFALEHLHAQDPYICSIFGDAQNPGALVERIGGLGRSCIINLKSSHAEGGVLSVSEVVQAPRSTGRVMHFIGRFLTKRKTDELDIYRWNTVDYDGKPLYDSGLINIQNQMVPPDLIAEALAEFRDYALIVLRLPFDCSVADANCPLEIKEQLMHAYILAEVPAADGHLIVLTKKLFTTSNFRKSLLGIAPREMQVELETMLHDFVGARVNFFTNNLYQRMYGR